MSRRNAAQPAQTPAVSNPSVQTKKPRLIRDLNTISDAHLAVIITFQVDKDGNVIAERDVEFIRGQHIIFLTHVAIDRSRGWILSMYDPEADETNDFERMSPTSGPLGRLRKAFLDHAMVKERRQLA